MCSSQLNFFQNHNGRTDTISSAQNAILRCWLKWASSDVSAKTWNIDDDDDDIGDDADDNSDLGEEGENEEELADVGWEPWKPQGRTSLPQPMVLYCSTPTLLILEHQ